MTSCSLIDFQKNNIISFDEKNNQFKALIVPKGITIPKKNKAYDIPYAQRDLEGENYNIFPPV